MDMDTTTIVWVMIASMMQIYLQQTKKMDTLQRRIQVQVEQMVFTGMQQ